MNSTTITFNEVIVCFSLLFIFLLPFKLLKNKNKLYFAHPLIIFSGIMIYYCLLSPISSLLSSCSVIAGYYSIKTDFKKIKKFACNIKFDSLWNLGLMINIFGLFAFLLSNGFNFSIFNPLSEKNIGFDFLAY